MVMMIVFSGNDHRFPDLKMIDNDLFNLVLIEIDDHNFSYLILLIIIFLI